MNPLPRGRLKRLLVKGKDQPCIGTEYESIKRCIGSTSNSVQYNDPSPTPIDTNEGEARVFRSCEPDCASDSDASSVGDHLVDPEELDLNGAFFSQTFQSKPVICAHATEFSIESGESNLVDSYEHGSAATSDEGNEKMYQIFSQLTEFDRRINAVNDARDMALAGSQFALPQNTLYDGFDVTTMLTQIEGITNCFAPDEADRNWETVEDNDHGGRHYEEDNSSIEIFVTNTQHKPGRILDVAQSLRRLEQEKRKAQYLEQHKVHLLLLLSHGIQVNQILNSCVVEHDQELYELIQNSTLPAIERIDQQFVEAIVDHFRKNVKLCSQAPKRRGVKIKQGIGKQLRYREASGRTMLNYSLLTLLRFLTVRARLVLCLDVVPKHPPAQKATKHVRSTRTIPAAAHGRYGNVPLTTSEILKRKPEIQRIFQLPQIDGADDELNERTELPIKKGRLDCKPRLWRLKATSKSEVADSNKQPPAGIEVEKIVSSKFFRKKALSVRLPKIDSGKCRTVAKNETSKLSRLMKRKAPKDEQGNTKSKIPKARLPELNTWIECFLEQEKRWTVIEARLEGIDCMDQVIDRILDPPSYVFAWERDETIVDVSQRYSWRNEAQSKRQRVDEKWLKKALTRYKPPMLDEALLLEQREFRQLKFRAPMPKTIGHFKNHPSYCLKRDLQKFQAIYPPDAPPLGFINGEPIYARECVQTLHSREVWLRHAKVIRLHEEAYKIVTSKLRRVQVLLELFGYWQTEDYVPPEPVDGIVPRNAYGNIEIFKDCMLPKGTVHLKQYGLSHICRKLRIDYAVAVVGFGIHAGGNHPIFDGVVICEEHKDRLLEAWEQHQVEADHKKQEKKQQRVLNNWVKLVKGLWVRRRLKNKYNFDGM
ncbi:DNA repair protein complementing XP-C cells-like [Anopheles cruzii]|uniref:DNA repair protein complementing XP-C cells-like n=1 Tax=Anopheles cruzii TaxID=68878 RepID=UPI0022EC2E71|nr:DNA repair protein complementing XP-C cells-like [Anopheles cruzii]